MACKALEALKKLLPYCVMCDGNGFIWEGEEIDLLSTLKVDCGACAPAYAAIRDHQGCDGECDDRCPCFRAGMKEGLAYGDD